jgi:hypothetical protein
MHWLALISPRLWQQFPHSVSELSQSRVPFLPGTCLRTDSLSIREVSTKPGEIRGFLFCGSESGAVMVVTRS